MRPEVKDGIGPNLMKNPFFAQHIAPNVKKAVHWVGEDMMEYTVALSREPRTGEDVIFIAKTTWNGYMKHLLKLYIPDAQKILAALKEFIDNA